MLNAKSRSLTPRYLLHGHTTARKQLPSRRSFLDTCVALETSPATARIVEWQEKWNGLKSQIAQWKERGITPEECFATSQYQPWAVWKTLNRLRVGKGRCKASMKKWNLATSDACACGESQTMEHLMNCSHASRCAGEDLVEPSAAAVACTDYWKD